MKASPQGHGLHSAMQALADAVNQPREPLALHGLLSEDELHTAKCISPKATGRDAFDITPEPIRWTVERHAAFLASLATPRPFDEVDDLVEEIRRAEFEGKGATI